MHFAPPVKFIKRKIRTTPLELDEQAKVVRFCEANGLLFCATAQATYTPSYNQINRNRKMGVRKGFPDLCVAIRGYQSKKNVNYTVFLEMKRIKGGATSPEQKQWIDHLNSTSAFCFAKVFHGGDEAIIFLKSILKDPR